MKSFITDANDIERSTLEAWFAATVDAEIAVKDYTTSEQMRLFDVFVSVPGQRIKLFVSYNIENLEQNFIYKESWTPLTPATLFKHLWETARELLPTE